MNGTSEISALQSCQKSQTRVQLARRMQALPLWQISQEPKSKQRGGAHALGLSSWRILHAGGLEYHLTTGNLCAFPPFNKPTHSVPSLSTNDGISDPEFSRCIISTISTPFT